MDPLTVLDLVEPGDLPDPDAPIYFGPFSYGEAVGVDKGSVSTSEELVEVFFAGGRAFDEFHSCLFRKFSGPRGVRVACKNAEGIG